MKRLIFLAALPVAVGAQSLDGGTYDVYFQEISRQGELVGCSMVFTALIADNVYKRGEQVILNGNIALQTFEGSSLMFTAKLGTKPLMGEGDARESPAYFYIASDGRHSTAGKAKLTDSDVPGYKLLVTSVDDSITKMLGTIVRTGNFKLGFNRRDGGMDLNATINTTISLDRDAQGNGKRLVNKDTPAAFGGCMRRLATELDQRLSGKR
jgi:hypothetical protein